VGRKEAACEEAGRLKERESVLRAAIASAQEEAAVREGALLELEEVTVRKKELLAQMEALEVTRDAASAEMEWIASETTEVGSPLASDAAPPAADADAAADATNAWGGAQQLEDASRNDLRRMAKQAANDIVSLQAERQQRQAEAKASADAANIKKAAAASAEKKEMSGRCEWPQEGMRLLVLQGCGLRRMGVPLGWLYSMARHASVLTSARTGTSTSITASSKSTSPRLSPTTWLFASTRTAIGHSFSSMSTGSGTTLHQPHTEGRAVVPVLHTPRVRRPA
jgi:hypothetical protein